MNCLQIPACGNVLKNHLAISHPIHTRSPPTSTFCTFQMQPMIAVPQCVSNFACTRPVIHKSHVKFPSSPSSRTAACITVTSQNLRNTIKSFVKGSSVESISSKIAMLLIASFVHVCPYVFPMEYAYASVLFLFSCLL